MRGRRPSLTHTACLAFLVLLLTVSGGAASLAAPETAAPAAQATPSDEAAGAPAGTPALLELRDVPVEGLPGRARALAAFAGPSTLPAPDTIPGYLTQDETTKRIAWSAWVEASLLLGARGGDPFGLTGRSSDAVNEETAQAPEAIATSKGHGLEGLWSLDRHGEPRGLQPAGDDGAHFLVTSDGALHFPTATAAPDWMVKPGGRVGQTATTDANGDGVRDIVLGLYSWWVTSDPSVVVVDGATGKILWKGLAGLDSLYVWTLTDVDGDGRDDIMGIDAEGHLVAHTLDGEALYKVAVPKLIEADPVFLFLVYFVASHDTVMDGVFADVDADGTKDFVIASTVAARLGSIITIGRAEVPLVTAYSGVDAGLLWQMPTGTVRSMYGSIQPVSSGDFDGDGSEDILLVEYEMRILVGVMNLETRYKVLSGATGMLVASDTSGTLYVCTTTCTPHTYGGEAYTPIALADLDGDGQAELVGAIVERFPYRATIVGRGPPVVPGGPLQELYRHALKMEGTFEWASGPMTLRDSDGDGRPELIVFLYSEVMDEDGVLEDVAVHRFFVDDEAATGGRLAGLLGFYDVLPGGEAFGWDVRTDRWSTVDADGRRSAEGFRLVLSTYPLAIVDRNGDKVPDLLLPKSIGYLWIDGRNGRLLEDIDRPIATYAAGVYEEQGRQRLLERDWRADVYRLIDVVTLTEQWNVSRELAGDDGFVRGLADITGDGRLDLLFESWGRFYIERTGGPIVGEYEFREPERRFWAVDARSEETVFEVDTSSGRAQVADAVTTRQGQEVLVNTRDGEKRMLRLYVPGEEEPRWSYNLGEGDFRTAADGYVLVAVQQESEVFEILVGASGEQVAAYPLPPDGRATQTFFTPVNGDRFPDLVTSFIVEEADSTRQEMLIHDWANEEAIAQYSLEKGAPETIYIPEYDYEFVSESYSYVTEEVGDWDNDGLADFAYREADRAVVRASGSGEVLAIAPGKGSFIRAHDMNGAGLPEVFMVTDEGRLRLFSYSKSAMALAEEADSEGIRTITSVEGSETHEAAERFFAPPEEEGLPAPGFGLALLFLAFAVFVVRRRGERRE